MRRTPLLVAALAAAPLAACAKPKVGDACAAGRVACLDPQTELVCQDGKFVAAPCKGPKGCVVSGGTESCDISGNAAGDPCAPALEGNAACSEDKTHMVVCRAGKYQREACRGSNQCSPSTGRVECDTSVQRDGDSCTPDESYACSEDRKRALVCRAGRFVFFSHCRGAAGCERGGREVRCDRGRQQAGDPCVKSGDHECSIDGKALLSCKEGRWAVDRRCACEARDDHVGCKE